MIKDQLNIIRTGLGNWAKENNAAINVAHGKSHMFKILGTDAGSPRVAIMVFGEKPRNETYSDVSGRVDRKYWIAISRGYTLESYSGKSVVEGLAGGKPMVDLIEELRTALRSLQFPQTDEPVPYYGGFELMNFDGISLDAYYIEITVADEIGNNVDIPEPNFPET